MKKFLFFTGFILALFSLNVSAQELQGVGISKYAVLETLNNNTPLRTKDNEDAKRVSNLYKNTVLFADKQNKNYYRVELEDNNYAWINKKHIEVQGIIPEKRFEDIKKIKLTEDKKGYYLKIETNTKSIFQTIENDEGLKFILYDNYYDPENTKINSKKFSYTSKIDNKFKLQYNDEKPLFGYSVDELENDKGYLLTIKKAPFLNPKKPLKHLILTIDPGHGGSEAGACAFGYMEKDINLQISEKLKKQAKKRGAKVYLTRTKDKKVPLYDRISFAKEKQSDILLSIHQNSLPNREDVEKKHGTGVYYYNNQSKLLGQYILDNLVKDTGFRNDGLNYASFALTRATDEPSVLIECGYIIKKEEIEKLSNKKFQKIVAKAIVKGVEEYLKQSFL